LTYYLAQMAALSHRNAEAYLYSLTFGRFSAASGSTGSSSSVVHRLSFFRNHCDARRFYRRHRFINRRVFYRGRWYVLVCGPEIETTELRASGGRV
jgi:hypothetical protein